jgi:hypothetical protein
MAIVGVLQDDADPMVSVMKLEKAPQESYADVGGLDQQIQEIKVWPASFSFSRFSVLVGLFTLGFVTAWGGFRRRRSSCRSRTRSCTRRWVLSRQRA